MKEYIIAHKYGGFTEDEVVDAFNLSYARFRQDHDSPPEQLTERCMAEIRGGKERNVTKLAARYKTTEGQIRRALLNQPNIRIKPNERLIRQYAADGLTQDQIAQYMGTTKNRVKIALTKKRDKTFGDRVRTSLATGLYSQAELAAELGISQSAISYYAEENIKRPNKPKLKDSQWQELKSAYSLGSTVSELSKRYNISRAAIYRRLKQ